MPFLRHPAFCAENRRNVGVQRENSLKRKSEYDILGYNNIFMFFVSKEERSFVMQYRKFGNTGVEISTLGFGCMRLPEIDLGDGKFEVDQEKTDAMLRHAYDLGVNYFDTAFYYCHENSEIAVGKALKPIRDKVYISTKCPLERVKKPEDFEGMLDKSLAKLDTDYVDFYHFWGINRKSFDEIIKPLGLLEEAKKLKEKGKIRHISFSFHD